MRGNIWRLQQNRQKQLWLKRGHESQSAAFYSCGLCYFQIKDNGFDSKLKHRRSHLLDRPAAPLRWRQCFGLDRWETISSHQCVLKKMLFATTWGEKAQGTTFRWAAIIWGMTGRPELFQGTLNYRRVEVQLQKIQAWLVFIFICIVTRTTKKKFQLRRLRGFDVWHCLNTPLNKNLLHNWPHSFRPTPSVTTQRIWNFTSGHHSGLQVGQKKSIQCVTLTIVCNTDIRLCVVVRAVYGDRSPQHSVNSEHMKERARQTFHASVVQLIYTTTKKKTFRDTLAGFNI